MQGKIEEMHKEVTHIQNTVWAIYKDFLMDHDVKEYARKMGELSKEYSHRRDKLFLSFSQNLSVTWCNVINAFAQEFKNP